MSTTEEITNTTSSSTEATALIQENFGLAIVLGASLFGILWGIVNILLVSVLRFHIAIRYS